MWDVNPRLLVVWDWSSAVSHGRWQAPLFLLEDWDGGLKMADIKQRKADGEGQQEKQR